MSADVEPLAAALGRIPSGLFVLTARRGESETGMLASWVQQCAFDPPAVTACVRTGRFVLDWLEVGAALVVNIIPECGKALVAHFGKGFDAGEPAFAGLSVERAGDSPAVLRDALAHLVCRVTARVDVGDHVLLVARVESGAVHADGKPTVHTRKNGLRY
jgi:flavin reductase (DIM6/NTAB) family NADH-FMN oxidoreductase RutF